MWKVFGTRTQQSYLRSSSRQVQDQTVVPALYWGTWTLACTAFAPVRISFRNPSILGGFLLSAASVSGPSQQDVGQALVSQLSVLCIFPSSAWLCKARVSDSCRLVLTVVWIAHALLNWATASKPVFRVALCKQCTVRTTVPSGNSAEVREAKSLSDLSLASLPCCRWQGEQGLEEESTVGWGRLSLSTWLVMASLNIKEKDIRGALALLLCEGVLQVDCWEVRSDEPYLLC